LAGTSGEKPTANEAPRETEPCDPGRDLQEHDTLRERIRGEAERLGFTVEVAGQPEAQSRPRADLTLTKGSVSLAVEIAVSTTADHEFGNVKKCLDSDVARVAIVSPNPERLKAFAEAMHAGLPLEEAMKVGYFGPQELMEELRRVARTAEKPARGVRRSRVPRSAANPNQAEHTSER